jgi:hypothetical protein
MSEIKVNKITPRAACGTTQLGDSGDTFTVPAGATISNLGTATGFGGTGVVSWDTASIKTTGFTAVTGTGYFCDTSGGGFTVTLPLSPSAGDVIGVSDYAKTFDTYTCTLGRNGSNIGGTALDATLTTEGTAVTLVYVDATKGWIVTDSGNQSDAPQAQYVAATGGCITTCGNYKMHKFLSPNTFVVTAVGNCAGSNSVSYIVVAGGGGGGYERGGGGGAGGFRESKASSDAYTASPLNATSGPGYNLPVSATPYAIVVGGGGAGGTTRGTPATSGVDSSFSSITSTGGGGGGSHPPADNFGLTGGSGGGIRSGSPLGSTAGNTPPTSPAQGFPGGATNFPACGTPDYYGSGGGGATAAGSAASPTYACGTGGVGATTCISASPTAYAGGGGGGANCGPQPQLGGAGGGGNGGFCTTSGTAGGTNTGGGGGGGSGGHVPAMCGASGGSGIVIIRYRYQ